MYILKSSSFIKTLVNRSLRVSSTCFTHTVSSLKIINNILPQFYLGSKQFFILTLMFASILISNSYAYQSNNKYSSTDEQLKVKAAFILNLARFVEWPDEQKENIKKEVVVCFYQYNFLKDSVATILDKKINNKPIRIKTIIDLTVNEQCKVILIPASALSLFINYNDTKNLYNKITITDLSSDDIDDSLEEGWNKDNNNSLENKIIFRLKREKLRLRFEVNKIASERLGIKIGSELLKLGILVEDKESHIQREKP